MLFKQVKKKVVFMALLSRELLPVFGVWVDRGTKPAAGPA
jgi:hypothetical protein